jgi:hypothetical protein
MGLLLFNRDRSSVSNWSLPRALSCFTFLDRVLCWVTACLSQMHERGGILVLLNMFFYLDFIFFFSTFLSSSVYVFKKDALIQVQDVTLFCNREPEYQEIFRVVHAFTSFRPPSVSFQGGP